MDIFKELFGDYIKKLLEKIKKWGIGKIIVDISLLITIILFFYFKIPQYSNSVLETGYVETANGILKRFFVYTFLISILVLNIFRLIIIVIYRAIVYLINKIKELCKKD